MSWNRDFSFLLVSGIVVDMVPLSLSPSQEFTLVFTVYLVLQPAVVMICHCVYLLPNSHLNGSCPESKMYNWKRMMESLKDKSR